MITEISIKDFKKANDEVRQNWPLYVVWRHDGKDALEAWGCDTKDEVDQKFNELTQKEGSVVVAQFRSRQTTSAIN